MAFGLAMPECVPPLDESEENDLIWAKERVAEILERVFGKSKVRLYFETKRHLTIAGRVVTFGTPDTVAYSEALGIAVLFDLKFWHQEPPEEYLATQLECYGTLIYQDIPKLQEVLLVALVPPIEQVLELEMDRERALEYQQLYLSVEHQSRRADAPLVVGNWCGMCRAKAICPRMQEIVQLTVEQAKNILPLDETELGKDWERLKLAEAVVTERLTAIRNRALQGGPVPKGTKVCRREGARFLTDIPEALSRLRSVLKERLESECMSVKFRRLAEELKLQLMRQGKPQVTVDDLLAGCVARAKESFYLARIKNAGPYRKRGEARPLERIDHGKD